MKNFVLNVCLHFRVGLVTALFLAGAKNASAMSTSDFQGLIDGAPSGGRVELTEDVDLTAAVAIDKSLTIASVGGSRFAIRQNASYAGSLLTVASGSTAEIIFEDIVLDGNKASGVRLSSGLITINGGKVILGEGAVVRDCSGVGNKEGTTLSVYEGGVLEMLDGSEIRDCDNNAYGTAVYVRKGTFNMKGGLITGCSSLRANGGNSYGGAVYEWEGTVNISGGLVTGNTAEGCGAGLVVYSGALEISGDATLTNNVSAGGYANDVYCNPQGGATVAGDYRGYMTVYVAERPREDGYTQSEVHKSDPGPHSGFGNISPQGYPEFGLNGWYDMTTKETTATWWELRSYARGRDGKLMYFTTKGDELNATLADGDTIFYMADEVWTKTFAFPSGLSSLTLSSLPGGPVHAITRQVKSATTPFPLLELQDKSIRIENLVLDGNGTGGAGVDNVNVGIARVNAGGMLTLGAGAVLRNGSCETRSAGVSLDGTGAKLVMEDGSLITGCTLTGGASYGAAVLIGNGSSGPQFEMKGGAISGCAALTTSAATSGYGGTVYVYGGDFVMSGGAITDNACEKSVGGVLYYSGTMSLSGAATVFGNSGFYPDLYVHDGDTKRANVHASGALSGRIGVSVANLAEGSLVPITADEGLGGIWNIVPSAQDGVVSGLAAALDLQNPGDVKWQASAGSIDDVQFASVADAQAACPRELSVDPADLSGLPHVFSGCACEIEAQIVLGFDVAAMETYLEDHPEGITLLQAETGSAFAGGITFVLPADADDLTVTCGRTRCRLTRKRGLAIILR